jgi:predicted kinase
MTTILVSALLIHGDCALLARAAGGNWELPTVPLAENESTEEALARLLERDLDARLMDEEFVDSVYERLDGGEPVIRNVFLVRGWQGQPALTSATAYRDMRWFSPLDLGDVDLRESERSMLRRALDSASDEPVPGACITILTGPAGAGKTTVASRLCHRLERAAHIEVDLLRDMIIAGYASPIPSDRGDPAAVAEQNRLAAMNAAALARNFSLAGYEVAIDAVLETAEALDEILAGLSGVAPVSLITLMPDAVTLQARDAVRDPDLRLGQRCLDLRDVYETNGERRGLRLDNSHLSVSETVSWILANRDRARVL